MPAKNKPAAAVAPESASARKPAAKAKPARKAEKKAPAAAAAPVVETAASASSETPPASASAKAAKTPRKPAPRRTSRAVAEPAVAPAAAPADDSITGSPEAAVAAAPEAAPATTEPAAAPDAAALAARVAELEARLERGLRFVHVVMDRNQRAIESHAALLHGLGDAAVRRAGVKAGEVAAARDAYLRSAPPPAFRVRVAPDVDKYAVPAAEVDCAARLALCKAACCRKPFALGTQDLEEGVVKWDWADPYVNRRDAEGRCVHHGEDGGCTVHAQRPLRCRRYDCRDDASVWIDFDRRIPHPDLAALPTPTTAR